MRVISVPFTAASVQSSVHQEMADLGSEQGLSNFETGAIAKAIERISKLRNRSSGPKDAI
jgi:hypothetical protein